MYGNGSFFHKHHHRDGERSIVMCDGGVFFGRMDGSLVLRFEMYVKIFTLKENW